MAPAPVPWWLAVVPFAVIALVYAILAHEVEAPRIFDDELTYAGAAASLAGGDGLSVRGEGYGWGLLYPVLLSGVLRAFPDRVVAYELFKLLNVTLFLATAGPVYLIAKRLVSSRWSLAVGLLSVLVPSALYVSVVQTESLAYPASAVAMYAVLRVLEEPSGRRQLAALTALALAYLARPQLAALAGAYVVALAVARLLDPEGGSRYGVRRLAPSLLAGGVALAAAVSVTGILGSYRVLVGAVDPAQLGRWLEYHAMVLELYVGVVPLVVAPIVLVAMARRARSGSATDRGFVALFAGANAAFLAVAAAFASTQYGLGWIYDRFLFYVIPLWVLLAVYWISKGAPRPRRPLLVGMAAAFALPSLLPQSETLQEDGARQFQAVSTLLWAKVHTITGHGDDVLALFVLIAALAIAVVPRGRGWLAIALVTAVFVSNGALAWKHAFSDQAAATVFGSRMSEERTWVDDAVGRDAQVVLVRVAGPRCDDALQRDAYRMTEFFNSAVRHIVDLTGARALGALPEIPARVRSDGVLVAPSGAPIASSYAVIPNGVPLAGERVSVRTRAKLVLWRVHGPLRLRGGQEVPRTACS